MILADLARVVVGYSGGVDSTYLALIATKVLGVDNVSAVIADSPSLSREELVTATQVAQNLGLQFQVVRTTEFNDGRYLQNDSMRCSYCKSALMDSLLPIAKAKRATVVLGVNLSDQGDYRPGQQFAASKGARFPLLEAGITKDMIRLHSKKLGVPNHDKPASPCLSSRVPYGTAISINLLSRIEKAERFLHQLGFLDVRVRDYDSVARIEVDQESMQELIVANGAIDEYFKKLGYRYVTLDLAGLVSGNLNSVLHEASA